MPARRHKPGPKPSLLRRPVMIRFGLSVETCKALDAWAAEQGVNRSEALRRAVVRLVGKPTTGR